MIEAEIIETAPVLSDIKYPVNTNDLDKLLSEYKEIPEINPNSDDLDLVGEQYQFVLKGHKAFVKARNQIEKTRKELKAPALEYGKSVDNIAKEFQAKIKATEDKLQIQRKLVEDNEARKQAEAEAAEEARITNIKQSINSLKQSPMECIGKSAEVIHEVLKLLEAPTEEIYEEFFDEAVLTHSSVVNQIIQMHDNQLLVDNAQKIQEEAEAEAKRIQDAKDAVDRLEKEKFAEEQATFQKEKDDFAQQRREAQEVIDREEADRVANELQAKQEADRQESIKKDLESKEKKIAETIKCMNKYTDNSLLLNEIIAGVIPNVKWEM